MKTTFTQATSVAKKLITTQNKFVTRSLILTMIILLGVGKMWAGSNYYTAFNVTSNDTGKGLVYTPSTVNNNTAPTEDSQYGASGSVGQSSDTGGSSKTNSYYAWAKAARGYAFDGWTVSGSYDGVTIDNTSKAAGAKITVTSNKADGTNTGTATAKWKTDPNTVTVTFGVPVDGSYTVSYSYTTIENNAFTTGGYNFSMTESSTAASGQQTSYAGDVVTVSSDASNFDGWYNNASFTGTALETNSSYTFTVSGETSVYAKFKTATKYFGQLDASIAAVPYSMPGGGTIYISDIEGTSGVTFSENPQTAKITTYNSDATPPASVNQTYYLYAQPNDKRYVFRGWYDNATCTGTPLSTNASWAYTFAVSSHAEGSPTTKTVYAAFDFNLYYMEVQAQPATPGLGMVLVSDTKLTSPAYTEFSSESSQFAYAYRVTHTTDVYVYAKPKYGYKLSGWYTDAACTVAASVASDGKYTASSTASTDPLNPDTITLYAKFVEDATTINITYNKPDQTKGEYTASVLDIVEVDDEYVWTFTEVFTSVEKTANTTQAQHKTDVLRLEATPKTGYGVTSWTDGSTPKTTPSSLYETTGTAAKTVGVAFGDAKPFLVSTNSTQYATLREALTAVGSSGKITVVQNAYVEAGDYTIPSGVSLIVPYESTGATYTSPSSTYEKNQAYSSASQYVLLTLGSGANITVAGSLYVMADLCAPNGGGAGSGAPATSFGRIEMSKNSTITINNSANLYCWGFVTGIQGLVTVKNGGKVHEVFQHQNNPGGSAASGWNEKAFFLNQYYVQNVESPLKIEYGATETVYAQMTVPSGSIKNVNAALVGTNDTGLFGLTSSGSYLVRTYNPATDRTTYDIYGNAKLNYISMTIYTMTIDTRNYVLPITSNMSVKCHTLNGSASTFSVPYAVSFLPGAELIVDEGVTVNISSKLIIYDRDEWIDKGFAEFNLYSGGTNWSRSSFTPTRTYTRTKADLVDAKVDLNGTMSVSGSLYTTSNGAAIISSNGTGTINLSAAAPGNSNDIQYASNKLGTSVNVPMTPAQLLNGDGSYLATAGAVSGDKFIYSKNLNKWMKNPKTVTWNANGGTTEATTMAYSQDAFIGELPAAYRDGYTLAGWFTTESGGTQITQTTKVTANATYYAHWTQKQYDITYMDQGKAAFSSTHIDTPDAHPTKHTYGTTTTLNGVNNKSGYTFDGWHTLSNCKAESKVTSLGATAFTKDITLYAKWTVNTHKFAWNFDGGTPSGSYTEANNALAYGSAITYPTLSKTGYTFAGWSSDATSMPDADLTITASWTIDQYTLTVLSADETMGTVTGDGLYDYGTNVTITATPKSGFKFVKWDDDNTNASREVTIPVGGVTYTATFEADIANYTVKHWQQNLTADGYDEVEADRQTTSGTIGEQTAAEAKTYEGFTARSFEQVTIAVSGTVVNIYYDRNTNNITSSPASGGSYTVKVGGVEVVSGKFGQTVTLSATADSYYSFTSWSVTAGENAVTVTNNQFTMPDADVTISATFTRNTQPITITIPDEGGTVTGVVSGNSYPEGSEQTIEAVPAEHYHFVEWSDHITDNPRTITVGTSNVYTPIFAINTHKLLWNFDGGTPSGSYTEANNTLAYGSTITYPTTVTKDGYQLSGWSSSPSGNPETMPDEDLTITALWVETYTITFMNFDNEEWSECWSEPFAEGAEIVYNGPEPTRPSTNQYEYTFIGWSETAVTGAEGEVLTSLGTASESCTKTFYARYSKEEVEYDIKWINWNGDLLDSSTRTYGYTPLPEYGGDAPTRPTTDGQMYRWIGWDNQDEAIAAGKEVTFTAQFESITELVATAENPIEITENTTVNVTIVKVKGNLTVEEGSMLTTEDLILEASNDDSGNILDVNRVLLKVNGHAYFDYEFNTDPWHWNAFGVPFVIDLDEVAPLKEKTASLNILGSDDYDIIYYDTEERASNGPSKNCWKYIDAQSEHKLYPGKLYMIAFDKHVGHVNVLRFTKASGATIDYNEDVELITTGEKGGNNNWNGIANPKTFHALLGAGVTECQVHDGGAFGNDGYQTYDMDAKKFIVGKAVFVQVPNHQDPVVVNKADDESEIAIKTAPRRAKTQTNAERYDVQIAPVDGEMADRLFILADEDKAEEYIIVADLAKAGISPVRAQMWVEKYGEQLCKNTATMINNQAVYPLGISVPNAGEYEIYINERPEEDAVLYLTFDGRPIWNLYYGPYTANLEKGTTQHYGLLLVRRNVPTDIDPVQATEQSSAQKLLIDDKVYIFRNGAVYTITGQTIK